MYWKCWRCFSVMNASRLRLWGVPAMPRRRPLCVRPPLSVQTWIWGQRYFLQPSSTWVVFSWILRYYRARWRLHRNLTNRRRGALSACWSDQSDPDLVLINDSPPLLQEQNFLPHRKTENRSGIMIYNIYETKLRGVKRAKIKMLSGSVSLYDQNTDMINIMLDILLNNKQVQKTTYTQAEE